MFKLSSLFHGWSLFEKCWIIIFTAIQIYLFFAWKDNALGLISSLSNMLCVVLVAKGRMENFFFGVIATATYAYISYKNQIFGEAMLSAFFYFPMQFIGIYFWLKHQNKKTDDHEQDIQVQRLSPKGWLITLLIIVIGSFCYAELLALLNAKQIKLDSFTVVISIVAQILMTMRYAEQWLLWLTTNILGIFIWLNAHDYHMVMMWTALLLNSSYGWWQWRKHAIQTA